MLEADGEFEEHRLKFGQFVKLSLIVKSQILQSVTLFCHFSTLTLSRCYVIYCVLCFLSWYGLSLVVVSKFLVQIAFSLLMYSWLALFSSPNSFEVANTVISFYHIQIVG